MAVLLFLLLLLLSFNLILVTSAQTLSYSPPPPPPSGCATDLVAFSPCLMYVSLPPNNWTDTVPSQCCEAVSSVLNSGDGNCLCYLIRQPLIFGFPLNETRILSLSSACNANGSLEFICSLGSPALPPLHSTTGSESSKPSDTDPANATAPTLSLPAADGAIPITESSPVKPASGSSISRSRLLPAVLIILMSVHM